MSRGNKEDREYVLDSLRKTMYSIGIEYQKKGKKLNMFDTCTAVACFVCECFYYNNVSMDLVKSLGDFNQGIKDDGDENLSRTN